MEMLEILIERSKKSEIIYLEEILELAKELHPIISFDQLKGVIGLTWSAGALEARVEEGERTKKLLADIKSIL